MTKWRSNFLLALRTFRSKSCDRAVRHERAARRCIEGFSRFCPSTAGSGSHSTADENGINKKHLQRLISIVNLAKPFSVLLQQV
jgi:hypothetical protein